MSPVTAGSSILVLPGDQSSEPGAAGFPDLLGLASVPAASPAEICEPDGADPDTALGEDETAEPGEELANSLIAIADLSLNPVAAAPLIAVVIPAALQTGRPATPVNEEAAGSVKQFSAVSISARPYSEPSRDATISRTTVADPAPRTTAPKDFDAAAPTSAVPPLAAFANDAPRPVGSEQGQTAPPDPVTTKGAPVAAPVLAAVPPVALVEAAARSAAPVVVMQPTPPGAAPRPRTDRPVAAGPPPRGRIVNDSLEPRTPTLAGAPPPAFRLPDQPGGGPTMRQPADIFGTDAPVLSVGTSHPGSFEVATDRLGIVGVAIDAREASLGVRLSVDTAAAGIVIGNQHHRLADAIATGGQRLDSLSVDIRGGGGGSEPRRSPSDTPPRPAAVAHRQPPRPSRADRFA